MSGTKDQRTTTKNGRSGGPHLLSDNYYYYYINQQLLAPGHGRKGKARETVAAVVVAATEMPESHVRRLKILSRIPWLLSQV